MRTSKLTTLSSAVIGLGLLGAVVPATASIVEIERAGLCAATYPPPTYFRRTTRLQTRRAATPIFYDPSCRTVRQRSGSIVIECDDGYIE